MHVAVLLVVLLLSLAAALPAFAHDSWFRLMPSGRPPLLNLGTGERYPKHETAIAPEYLDSQACRPADAPGGERAMRTLSYDSGQALRMQAPPASRTCWAQLVPLDVEVAPQLVDNYLHEIRAGADTLAAWQAQRRLGLPWRERYVKHARIDFGASPDGAAPVPMGMDLVQRPEGMLQVLRDGQPLSGQAVELLGDRAPFGIWRLSDAAGLLVLGALPPGRWLARAVDLRPRDDAPGQWDSRFVTLAFELRADSERRHVEQRADSERRHVEQRAAGRLGDGRHARVRDAPLHRDRVEVLDDLVGVADDPHTQLARCFLLHHRGRQKHTCALTAKGLHQRAVIEFAHHRGGELVAGEPGVELRAGRRARARQQHGGAVQALRERALQPVGQAGCAVEAHG
jgi:hypothetical protein